MRAIRNSASRAGKNRPTLLGSCMALCEMRTETTLLLIAKSGFLVKMSNISVMNFITRKKKKKGKEKRSGHTIKCLLTELGRTRRENIWYSGQIFTTLPPPTQSISTYYEQEPHLTLDFAAFVSNQTKCKSKEHSEESDSEEDPVKLQKQRDWDEWKDGKQVYGLCCF